jgi:anti-sigma factor (TIGR02949 family)
VTVSGACKPVVTRLDAYEDGELSPEQVLEIEAHLAECHGCSSRLQLDHAVRKSLRRATYTAAVPSDAFRERLMHSLRAETERAETAEKEAAPRPTMLSWSNIAPLAAAAAFALFWKAQPGAKVEPPDPDGTKNASMTQPFNMEQLLEDIVEQHFDRSAPAVTEASLVEKQIQPDVGVPVHAPNLLQYGARWEGGSVVPLRMEGTQVARSEPLKAASLRYRVAGQRMTLYVFNSERLPFSSRFTKRVVRNEPVYVTVKRGVSIAAMDRRGVGYAVATELSEDEGAEIVASLH